MGHSRNQKTYEQALMTPITPSILQEWCRIPATELENHPARKVPFRIAADSAVMGALMARELADLIAGNNAKKLPTRAIIPCGPACWYKPFAEVVNREQISLRNLTVFHMDECLDWQGRELPRNHPYSFRGFMEREFYGPVDPALVTPEEKRWWPNATNFQEIADEIAREPIDITYGGWGQDGHIAYNQARRHPFSALSLDDLRNCTVRVQDNNLDTIIALAQRTFGCAYQFVPPMSVTLGLKECLSAKKVRLFSDTGAWKQTALRVALFSEPTPEYPMTLLQEHPDALVTATLETATHPVSIHPEWDLGI
jgi:glucosamine-6-phosphate deaminase